MCFISSSSSSTTTTTAATTTNNNTNNTFDYSYCSGPWSPRCRSRGSSRWPAARRAAPATARPPSLPLHPSSSLFIALHRSSSLFIPLHFSSSLFIPVHPSSSLSNPLHPSSSLFIPLHPFPSPSPSSSLFPKSTGSRTSQSPPRREAGIFQSDGRVHKLFKISSSIIQYCCLITACRLQFLGWDSSLKRVLEAGYISCYIVLQHISL